MSTSKAEGNRSAKVNQVLRQVTRWLAVQIVGQAASAYAAEPAIQPDLSAGLAACGAAAKNINVLADFTITSCVPARSDTGPGVSFLVVGQTVFFREENRKQAWLLLVCAALGSRLNEDKKLVAHEIWLGDAALVGSRSALRIPAETCKSLQREMKADAITLPQMYQRMQAQMTTFKLPPKKPQ